MMMTVDTNRHKPAAARRSLAVYLLLFVVLTFTYYIAFRIWPHNSDDANSLLIGYDIFHGNPLLKGWFTPPDSFYATDAIYLGLFSSILGPTLPVMVLTPAAIWAATVVAALIYAVRGGENRWLAATLVLAILAFPIISVSSPMQMEMITRAPMHIATVVYALLMFGMARHWLSRDSHRWLNGIALTAFMAITAASDPLIIFIGALPIMAACLHIMLTSRIYRRPIMLAGLMVAGVVAGKLILVAVHMGGGFIAHPQPLIFSEFHNLGHNIALYIQSLLSLFGANFTGKAVSTEGQGLLAFVARGPMVMVVRVLVLMLVLLSAIYTCVRIARKRPVDTLDIMLVSSMTIISAAAILSNQMTDVTSMRYLFPVLIFGILLAARTTHASAITWSVAAGAFVISGISFAATIAVEKPSLVSSEHQQLADWLRENNLSEGYGPFWSASIVTLASHGEVQVRAVAPSGPSSLSPFTWLSNAQWYDEPDPGERRFVIYDSRGGAFVYERERAVATLGQPIESHPVGPFEVMIYETDKADFTPLSLDNRPFAYEGWYDSEGTHRWSEGSQSTLGFLLTSTTADRCLVLNGVSNGAQTITASVDARAAVEAEFDGRGTMTVPLGEAEGPTEILLKYSDPHAPNDADSRVLAFALETLSVVPCA